MKKVTGGSSLQKAILFARINEEKKKSSSGSLSGALSAFENKRNGSSEIEGQMKAKGYSGIPVQYNPETIQITTNADISEADEGVGTKGDSGGAVSLPAVRRLSFQLIFEAVEAGENQNHVRNNAEGIVALMVSDITRRVGFYYGGILFTGELTNVSVSYKMFDGKGNPVWAVVSVSIQEQEEEEKPAASSGQQHTDTSSEQILKEYGDFSNPVVVITINGKDISENKSELSVSDLEVELTSGYEASIATFSIYNSFDKNQSAFRTEDIKKYTMLGSAVAISMGYGEVAKNIFRGFIARVNYIYSNGEQPHVELTCMDIKGIMMSGSHAKQLAAVSYSDAVNEIFQKSVYDRLQSEEIITQLSISATPDKRSNAGGDNTAEHTIEMVNESDYEFVVRAAKKFNYEFFIDSGTVIFRKAKSVTSKLMDLKLEHGIKNFDVEYDMTGLVESIQVRGMDSGKVKLIKAKRKWNNKISQGNKAKQYIKKSEKIYIDPTVSNQQEADYRSEYLMEDMSYRFGTFTCECKGIPDLKPGNLIGIQGMGVPVDNEFYITTVRHMFHSDNEYTSHLTGKAAALTQG